MNVLEMMNSLTLSGMVTLKWVKISVVVGVSVIMTVFSWQVYLIYQCVHGRCVSNVVVPASSSNMQSIWYTTD